ncbi:hypothetical protein PsorP6_009945 [Peronosclerospora sorghi]|uniref:Uncharacterized protein n=1 Tax=Peronosclerospora sorghi TaxID=230839 RepID=A0ACC0VWX1_9STRA|nr:hypothetical protein PsorP6_009945 [Peronosclerospora sorghi]
MYRRSGAPRASIRGQHPLYEFGGLKCTPCDEETAPGDCFQDAAEKYHAAAGFACCTRKVEQGQIPTRNQIQQQQQK